MSGYVSQRAARDPHDVLGVPPGATRQQIVRAFHRMARRGGHPDAGGDAATFDEIVRAKDALLDRVGRADDGPPASTVRPTGAPRARGSTGHAARERGPRVDPPEAPATAASDAGSAPDPAPTPRMSRLAVATVVLTLLGPFFWPLAFVVGLGARWSIRRTGLGGGTLVSVIVFVLGILTVPVLVRILSVVLIP